MSPLRPEANNQAHRDEPDIEGGPDGQGCAKIFRGVTMGVSVAGLVRVARMIVSRRRRILTAVHVCARAAVALSAPRRMAERAAPFFATAASFNAQLILQSRVVPPEQLSIVRSSSFARRSPSACGMDIHPS